MNGLAIDIDDTLAETARTCIEIVAGKLGTHREFTTDELAFTYHQPGNVPFWKEEHAQKLIDETMTSKEFLENIPVVPGAIESLQKINQIVPVSLYISSRLTSLQTVTQAWLEKNGFPKAPIILRDEQTMDPHWKATYLEVNYPKIFGIIDDTIEPYLASNWLFPSRFFWLQRHKKNALYNENLKSSETWEGMSKLVINLWKEKRSHGR